MGREIRRVPAGWEPPKVVRDRYVMPENPSLEQMAYVMVYGRTQPVEEYQPQNDRSLREAQAEWDQEIGSFTERYNKADAVAYREAYGNLPSNEAYIKYAGERPTEGTPWAAYYRPDWTDEERTHYQVYQTVSEGTPVSPTFGTLTELEDWLVREGYSRKAAHAFAEGGWAPSMMTITGGPNAGVYNDIESLTMTDKTS